jgi:hypothetical protein
MKYLRVIAVFIGISAYVYYQWEYLKTGLKPNEFYFTFSSICISMFSALSISKEDPLFIRSLQVLCSIFFFMIAFIYVKRWVIEGHPSTNYYNGLIISAAITFLYLVYMAIEKYLKQLYNAFFGRK